MVLVHLISGYHLLQTGVAVGKGGGSGLLSRKFQPTASDDFPLAAGIPQSDELFVSLIAFRQAARDDTCVHLLLAGLALPLQGWGKTPGNYGGCGFWRRCHGCLPVRSGKLVRVGDGHALPLFGGRTGGGRSGDGRTNWDEYWLLGVWSRDGSGLRRRGRPRSGDVEFGLLDELVGHVRGRHRERLLLVHSGEEHHIRIRVEWWHGGVCHVECVDW